ncbi:hypothetical protein MP638_003590 [Amoeboaphelidium occidentale]|nr:hypothetical protein MP638_003590 [Amoeboaphelidium occidentale]
MKFGKFISSNAIPEWSTQYMNYKALKKIIGVAENKPEKHQLTVAAQSVSMSPDSNAALTVDGSPIPHSFEGAKTHFFFRMERELEKVNAFYLRKEAELRSRLKSLVEKKSLLLSRKGKSYGSVSLISLRDALNDFQHDLSKLLRFVELNETGFRKILKKWDKRSKMHTKELYLSRQIEVQPCFNRDILNEIGDLASVALHELAALDSNGGNVPLLREVHESEDANYNAASVENEQENALLRALAIGGSVSLLKDLIPKVDIETVNRVFWKLCSRNDTSEDSVDILQEHFKIEFNYSDDVSDKTCVHNAASSGNLVLLKKCAIGGGSIKTQDMYGRRPLHYAAMNGHYDCCKYLLDCGAVAMDEALSPSKMADSIDHDGFSPLLYAIIQGHENVVALLLESGAVLSSGVYSRNVPLCLACEYGHVKITELLLKQGVLLSVANDSGLYPIHLACKEGHVEILKLLSSQSAFAAEIDRRDKYNGWTPLFYCASEGYLECAKILVDKGCTTFVLDETNWTPWSYSLWNGHVQTAAFLESSITVEQRNEVGSPSKLRMESLDEALPPLSLDAGVASDSELPSLSLPPPMIPVYGHNYLDRKAAIYVYLGNVQSPLKSAVSFYNTKQLSVSLNISCHSKNGAISGIPYIVILPSEENNEVYKFTFDDPKECSINFAILPSFGSKAIGKAFVLVKDALMHLHDVSYNSNTVSTNGRFSTTLPIIDFRSKVVGEIAVELFVVMPFSHPMMDIGQVGTYWKSSHVVQSFSPAPPIGSPAMKTLGRRLITSPKKTNSAAGNSVSLASLVVATSLCPKNAHLVVQVTKDMIPIVCPDLFIAENGLKLSVSQLSFQQLKEAQVGRESMSEKVHDIGSYVNEVYSNIMTLRDALDYSMDLNDGVQIEIKYPFYNKKDVPIVGVSLNEAVDATLSVVFDYLSRCASLDSDSKRSILFSSGNPLVCMAVNMKQPNFPVFYQCCCGFKIDDDFVPVEELDKRKRKTGLHSLGSLGAPSFRPDSLKEAVRFAKREGLLGLMVNNKHIEKIPILSRTIKESGLVLSFTEDGHTSSIL